MQTVASHLAARPALFKTKPLRPALDEKTAKAYDSFVSLSRQKIHMSSEPVANPAKPKRKKKAMASIEVPTTAPRAPAVPSISGVTSPPARDSEEASSTTTAVGPRARSAATAQVKYGKPKASHAGAREKTRDTADAIASPAAVGSSVYAAESPKSAKRPAPGPSSDPVIPAPSLSASAPFRKIQHSLLEQATAASDPGASPAAYDEGHVSGVKKRRLDMDFSKQALQHDSGDASDTTEQSLPPIVVLSKRAMEKKPQARARRDSLKRPDEDAEDSARPRASAANGQQARGGRVTFVVNLTNVEEDIASLQYMLEKTGEGNSNWRDLSLALAALQQAKLT